MACPKQRAMAMAAIMALAFVPALAGTLFMLGGVGDLSFTTAFATTIFIALATGLLAGLFRLARQWDDEPATRH